ncbi:hypothetical protein BDR04DRAFT_1164843 [Suillus decipiens]|nr:hypothetical protein BDR04DRAFT_1164843 [Suillus decipiens]
MPSHTKSGHDIAFPTLLTPILHTLMVFHLRFQNVQITTMLPPGTSVIHPFSTSDVLILCIDVSSTLDFTSPKPIDTLRRFPLGIGHVPLKGGIGTPLSAQLLDRLPAPSSDSTLPVLATPTSLETYAKSFTINGQVVFEEPPRLIVHFQEPCHIHDLTPHLHYDLRPNFNILETPDFRTSPVSLFTTLSSQSILSTVSPTAMSGLS